LKGARDARQREQSQPASANCVRAVCPKMYGWKCLSFSSGLAFALTRSRARLCGSLAVSLSAPLARRQETANLLPVSSCFPSCSQNLIDGGNHWQHSTNSFPFPCGDLNKPAASVRMDILPPRRKCFAPGRIHVPRTMIAASRQGCGHCTIYRCQSPSAR